MPPCPADLPPPEIWATLAPAARAEALAQISRMVLALVRPEAPPVAPRSPTAPHALRAETTDDALAAGIEDRR